MASDVLNELARSQMLERDFEREKLASLKQLAYGASHEINNPLANIATRAQLLLASEKDESRKKHLKIIWQQAMRAHEMISDMMLFAHPPEPALQSLDLTALVEQAARELAGQVTEAGWKLRIEIESSHLIAQADRSQLLSALQAIVQNSIESQPNGEVTIGCRRFDEARAIIEVSDNGPGVSSETARHMFDPFYSGREAGRGLGFGLSKAWTIVQLHQGNIRAMSTLGTGTTIAIELPLVPANN